tara:strand:- start:36 stop:308 length:273 start_codon:yes stop_codon:yes gene_type:complete
MTWSRNVARGMENFYLQEMKKKLATKRVKRTKLKVCLQYLKIANSLKRMYFRGFKRATYPDTYEYFKLIERKRKYAKQIIYIYKKERINA